VRVCFVCLGNICRSPAAEAILRRMAEEEGIDLVVDSAGTADYHVGEPPHELSEAEGRRRGYLLDHRGRQFTRADFAAYDLVVPLDAANEMDLRELAPDGEAARKVVRLGAFLPGPDGGLLDAADVEDVADPWGMPASAYAEMYDHLERACRALLQRIQDGTLGELLDAYAGGLTSR
jgi:protein-tyrosine phosphatase